jgi:hypothetical protein
LSFGDFFRDSIEQFAVTVILTTDLVTQAVVAGRKSV